MNPLASCLEDLTIWGLRPEARINLSFHHHTYERLVIAPGNRVMVSNVCSSWEARWRAVSLGFESWELILELTLTDGDLPADGAHHTWAQLGVELSGWSRTGYLAMPGYAYNGNRFMSKRLPYSPCPPSEDCRPDTPLLINDVPRLESGEGVSRIMALGGHLTDTAIGAWRQENGGVWMRTPRSSAWGDYGFDAEESPARDHLWLRASAPGVRENACYRSFDMLSSSQDRGVHPRCGESLELRIRLTRVASGGIPRMYEALHHQRGAGHDRPDRHHELPLSEAARLVLSKWDRDNWDETLGTYRSEVDAQAAMPFVAGWCGGMMTQQAQLAADDPLTRERAMRSLAWYWSQAPAPSGLLWTRWQRSTAALTHDQCHRHQPTRKRQTLVRRYGEIIERAIKQFDVIRQQNQDWHPPVAWSAAISGCCDALARIWREHGQWGQWLDAETGAILVGNSTSGIGCAAALACAGVFYDRPDWVLVAAAAAESLHMRDVRKGLTTGGPGDALAAPDSESGYAAIAAPISLWETTQDPRWLNFAIEAADLFATWVLAYEWPYPASSTLGRMGKSTLGAVWANIQNKHGAPGICTASGDALLRLYRATGERRFLQLLCDIVRVLPSYVSRQDAPIADQQGRGMPSGWINERITTNDWMEPPGEVFYGSCWCEVSLLLSAHELPGVYVRRDEGWACALDHLQVSVEVGSRLRIINPTRHDATTTLLVEDAASAAQPLRWNPFMRSERIRIPAGKCISIPL